MDAQKWGYMRRQTGIRRMDGHGHIRRYWSGPIRQVVEPARIATWLNGQETV